MLEIRRYRNANEVTVNSFQNFAIQDIHFLKAFIACPETLIIKHDIVITMDSEQLIC